MRLFILALGLVFLSGCFDVTATKLEGGGFLIKKDGVTLKCEKLMHVHDHLNFDPEDRPWISVHCEHTNASVQLAD